jgi:acyl carrier protein
MESKEVLRRRIKLMIVENLMLQVTVDEIGDQQPLFGPAGLGLDSVDALQLVVALEKEFGLKLADQGIARQVLQSVETMADAIQNCSSATPK